MRYAVIVSFRPFTLTRTGHVKDIDRVLADKIGDQLRGLFSGNVGRIDQFVRPLLLNAEVDRLLGPAAQFARINDNGSIGIFDVLQSSLSETAAFQLLDWITIWNPAEFIETSSWTPTPGLDSMF